MKTARPKRRKKIIAADLVYWGVSHPEGWLLAHNNIKHGVAARHGIGGFRVFWLEPKTHRHWVVCDCGWRPDLGTHYRRPEAEDDQAALSG
jgi:hypothetical protein